MTHTEQLTRLRRIRIVVRVALTLGVFASVAANILHANPNPISQAISAWAPLALLICVELISRVPVHRRSRAILRMTATAIIAGIAAWVSYWHMADVIARYGETGATPYLLPISVDGLIVVASISLVETGNRIRQLEEPAGSITAEPITTSNTGDTDTRHITDTPAPANPTQPAFAIPADTAARLAATFTPPAPATTPAPATHNGHQPAGTLAQEPLL